MLESNSRKRITCSSPALINKLTRSPRQGARGPKKGAKRLNHDDLGWGLSRAGHRTIRWPASYVITRSVMTR
jgi:hypothetical protein